MVVAHGETDIGRRPKVNEDTIFAARGLYVVCDGVGGHQAGEVASRLAVEAIANFIERSEADRELTWPFGVDPRVSYGANRLRTAVKLANRTVFEHATSTEACTGMGTTVAAVLIGAGEPRLTCASVGDSRVYRLRAGALAQLTRDDSWASLLAGEGVGEHAGGALKNVLTRALGARDDVEFDVVDHPLADGDTVLLCSDGLTNAVSDPRIAEIVTGHAADVAAACRALVTEANDRGGRDNVSVILARYRH